MLTMSIARLPDDTARLLRSSVAIVTPVDLVKELLENSIDAGATKVQIAITTDTLTEITVTDNGTGIDPRDFHQVGRRGHTSKLSSLEELRAKGGKTLGFRGEALASACTLAVIQVTTKTAKDLLATRFQLQPTVGGVLGPTTPLQSSVGTKVQALKLFELLPVRKKQYLKQSHHTIGKVKELVQAYAFARPSLKFTLKIKDAASAAPFLYFPTTNPTATDVALQLFGVEFASACIHAEAKFLPETSTSQKNSTAKKPCTVAFEVLLPKPGCQFGIIQGKGPLVSIDSRPISPKCDLVKKISNILKNHLRFGDGEDANNRVQKPFMVVKISCPEGSYDVNISTLKDEVLFEDQAKILNDFELLCTEIYSGAEAEDKANRSESTELLDTASNGSKDLTDNIEVEGSVRSSLMEEILADFPSCFDLPSRPIHKQSISPFISLISVTDTDEEGPRVTTPGEQSLVQVKLRTRKEEVNMARQGSEESVGGWEDDMIEVSVPSSAQRRHSKPSGIVSDKEKAHKYLFPDDIGNYFKPIKQKSFDIAIDETATTPTISPTIIEELALADEPKTQRKPLETMSESNLNCLRFEPQASDSSGGEEIEPLAANPQPRNTGPWNTFLPLRLPRRVESDQNSVNSIERLGSPPLLQSITTEIELPTPPPSDPRSRRSRIYPRTGRYRIREQAAGTANAMNRLSHQHPRYRQLRVDNYKRLSFQHEAGGDGGTPPPRYHPFESGNEDT